MTSSLSSPALTERVTNPFQRSVAASASSTASESASLRSESPVAVKQAPRVPVPGALALRPMTGFEEDFLETHAGDANTARLCNELLARCTVAPGADAQEALQAVRQWGVAERDRALLELRRQSLGDRVAMEVDCPACSETNEVNFDLSTLPVEIPEVPLPLEVPLSALQRSGPKGADESGEGRALLRLPTAGDQELLLEAPDESGATRLSRLLSLLLLEIEGRQGPFAPDEVHGLPTAHRRALEKAIEASTPDLSLDMAVLCCACGRDFATPFDVAVFFCLR